MDDDREIKRGIINKNKIINISYNGLIIDIESDFFFSELSKNLKFDVSGILKGAIRIDNLEYNFIPRGINITHFNLEKSYHKKDNIYVLSKIVKRGSFDGENEILPILDFKNCHICRCVECIENVVFEDLKESDFENSFSNISNKEELLDVLYQRYSQSVIGLTKEDILKVGVSITKLEKIGVIHEKSLAFLENLSK